MSERGGEVRGSQGLMRAFTEVWLAVVIGFQLLLVSRAKTRVRVLAFSVSSLKLGCLSLGQATKSEFLHGESCLSF